MTDARIGRLVAATLHEAIAERLPQRLEFYEEWLSSDALRDGSVGVAPLTAVLGFLRTENEGYDLVMDRAGELAATWSVASLPPIRHRIMGWLPKRMRARAALRIAARIVRDVSSASRAAARLRGSCARLEVTHSLFCAIREVQTTPMCRFYVAVAVEVLRQFGIPSRGGVEKCRAVGGSTCVLSLELTQASLSPSIAA